MRERYSVGINQKLLANIILLNKPLKKYLSHISANTVKFLKENKILYEIGFKEPRIKRNNEWWKDHIRRTEQLKAIKEVTLLSEKLGIDILIVKTFKPFNYAPDDIDVLLIDSNALEDLINIMTNEYDYFVRKVGTPEVTLRRIVNNTFVDVDIHTKMGAGPYEYIDKHYLWKRRKKLNFDKFSINIPNPIDELIITAAHSVMKELQVLLADLLHLVNFTKHYNVKNAIRTAKKLGLTIPLYILITLVEKITKSETIKERPYKKKNPNRDFIRILSNPKTFPCKVHPLLIGLAYKENIKHRIRNHGIKAIKELSRIASSKGTGILMRYIGL